MVMKTLFVVGSLLIAGVAQASQITCVGNYLGYDVLLRSKMQGARFTSNANLTITQNRQVIKQVSMRVVSSRFVPGQTLNFTARSAEGNIVVNTAFQSGASYAGQVDATSNSTSISVATVCTVK